ncbi:hypothetical protein BDV26DRAFT_272202 [Aspergillus bertholletiae]|uniref:Uncharacterized protein n=1 Tax=Aspergillus bertholletiae TaxID=1226010 RepID=A0A5N7AUG8_9EURO|nr:hypothetical protein BDV26DRAFT_272202 [Aspergillus bertholletiae]
MVHAWVFCVKPTMDGTWNLHHQLSSKLNFFVILPLRVSLTMHLQLETPSRTR